MFTGYQKEDFIQAAMLYFGVWLEENGVKLPKWVSMSLVNTKYGKKIRESLDLSEYSNLETIGKRVLERGLIELETLQPKEKFIEKNQKLIDRLIPKDLPFGSVITIREDHPHEISISLNLPFEELLKSNISIKELDNLKRVPKVVLEKMKKFLGIEEGNPLHGDFYIRTSYNFIDSDKWIKKFEKQIKPEIKKIQGDATIRAVKLKIGHKDHKPVIITLYFTSGRYYERDELRNKIFEMLQNKFGYNPDLISIGI